MELPSKKTYQGYALAFLLATSGLFIQWYISQHLRAPILGVLYPIAFLIAYYVGMGPSILATFVSTLGAAYLFYEPRYQFKVLSEEDSIRLGVFFFTSIFTAWLVSRGRSYHHRLTSVSRERDQSLEVVETINRVGKSLSAELDLQKLVQFVTDAATQISRAQFGSFFYNVTNEKGESYTLYTISGVPREKFSNFPMPRNTEVFAATFTGSEIVRSDDITKDPRYGKNSPYHGMPLGHLPVVSYLAVPVISRSGEVIGALFFGHPEPGVFTEREERIVAGLASQAAIAVDNARLFEKANQAVRVRDEFLSISSHELRTPLTPLKMQIQAISRFLRRGEKLSDETLGKMIEMSERQISRLTALVEDLLDVSRITSGKLRLNREVVNLTESVREVVERYQPQFHSVKCDVKLHLPEALPVHVDRLRYEQVLINLMTNAMKYAEGQPIDISLSSEGGLSVLKVSDRGMGISREDQKRIFDRFERVLSSSNYGGLGLGLFIVHQIVAAHNGTIEVDSESGKGATFTVKIPVGSPGTELEFAL